MSRIRLNQEYRNKIANRMRVHIEQENTQEKEKFFQLRENFKALQDKTWELAKLCVSRQYPKKDVDMARYLQDKYENVNTIAKDSCFHFGYMAKKGGEQEDTSSKWGREHDEQDDKYISKHFDFKLNGDMDGVDRQDDESYQPQSRDFAYAYFRDELKGREGCNPDITIEMEGKDRNPHEQKYKDANDKYLGFNCGSNNLTSYSAQWDKDYELDLIGREYCRDRQINVAKEEFAVFTFWQQAKGQLIMAHYQWIKSVLNQMKEIKMGLKGYRYLDEAIELCTELGLNVQEDEVIRTNSTGLVIYNPKNLAERIKGMKNKNFSREDKIKARLLYEQNQAIN
jgi:sarcosine oxidase delta subunit